MRGRWVSSPQETGVAVTSAGDAVAAVPGTQQGPDGIGVGALLRGAGAQSRGS
jgi:hypothetical protein